MHIAIKPSLTEFLVVNRRIREFTIKGRSKGNAAPHELRPRRHSNLRGDGLRQESPKLRVKPAQVMAGTIAVSPNAGTQPFYFRDQCLAVHLVEIIIHSTLQIRHQREIR